MNFLINILEIFFTGFWIYLTFNYLFYGKIFLMYRLFLHVYTIYLAIRHYKFLCNILSTITIFLTYLHLFLFTLRILMHYGPKIKFIKRIYLYLKMILHIIKRTRVYSRICNLYICL